MQVELNKAKLEEMKQTMLQRMRESEVGIAANPYSPMPKIEYVVRIIPGVSGGFAVYFNNEMWIASKVEDIGDIITAAIVRQKIKA